MARIWRITSVLLLGFLVTPFCSAQEAASPYVPADSWVYAVAERLIARGEFPNSGLGMRPWTRRQFAELLLRSEDSESEDIRALRQEFAHELGINGSGVFVDSFYVRSEQIMGRPLTNGFDFGQTVVNDFGRPNREGQNFIAGVDLHARSGRFFAAMRTELHYSGVDRYIVDSANIMSGLDGLAAAANLDGHAVHRVRMLEGYAGTSVANLLISIGNQDLHWSPAESGAMLMGENASPIAMLRLRNANALKLPWLFRYLGQIRGEIFIGKLGGHVQPFSPWLQGQKITLQMTPNLDLGFSRTIVFAGGGRGLASSFWRSFTSVGNNLSNTPGTPTDVGDRRGGFDFSYRVPGLRRYMTIYSEAFSDDDPSPLSAPRRAAILAGAYFPRLPHLHKMDLRMEAAYTDAPGIHRAGEFFYVNGGYAQSYSTDGQLMGHWVGRSGKAYEGSMTYWLSPLSKVQANVRTLQLSSDYLQGGGRQWDYAGKYDARVHGLDFSGIVQYERWRIPALDARERRNVAISIRVAFRPQMKLRIR